MSRMTRGPKLPASLISPSKQRRPRPRGPHKGEASASLADVYEYAEPAGVRRANVRIEYARGELDTVRVAGEDADRLGDDGEEENEEEGGERVGKTRARATPRLVGEDEQIGSEEDEEIDSDAAFEESDVERYAGLGLWKTTSSTDARRMRKMHATAGVKVRVFSWTSGYVKTVSSS